ncbi:MAG: response regulator transcription factor [Pseudomonadota bacterium]
MNLQTQNISNVLSASQGGRTQEAYLWPDFMVGQPSRPVRVAIVDDDALIRKVISGELYKDARTDVAMQSSSLREARRLIASSTFDVLLVDIILVDGNGLELIACTKSVHPKAEIIVISVLDDEQQALLAFELGAVGYLVKNSWFGNFAEAVLQVANGGASITPHIAKRLLRKLEPSQQTLSPYPRSDQQGLSTREKAVLSKITAGYTSAEIGVYLKISPETVNTHIKHIYSKLQVHCRAQAVNVATQRGLI